MQEFVDEIIKYLDSKFNADTNITNKPKGHYAYEKGLEPTATTPFYTVQLMDDKYSSHRITTMRRTASTPALPYGDGSKAYYSVIRYNITLKEI